MILLIPAMAFIARGAGSDWFGLKTLFGILFGLAFGFAAYHVWGQWYSIPGFLLSWAAFETAHAPFYAMIGYYDHNRNPKHPDKPRITKIERYIVRPIYVGLFKMDIYNPLYSWICMGVKGLFIGFAAGWWGLSLVILWPLAYWIGFRVEKHAAIPEYLSGMFAGTVILLSLGKFL